MREVKVENLGKIEVTDGEVRVLANSGDLTLVFPRALFERIITEASPSPEPTSEELEEMETLKRRLKEHAGESSFSTILEEVPCGSEDSEEKFDLVLRPAGIFAMTTGYLFSPVVSPEHVARLGVNLEEDDFVEQAYLVGVVAENQAFAAGDDRLKVLSIRGRQCSSSRFELAPELWQVLSEKLGWKNVELVAPVTEADDRKEG